MKRKGFFCPEMFKYKRGNTYPLSINKAYVTYCPLLTHLKTSSTYLLLGDSMISFKGHFIRETSKIISLGLAFQRESYAYEIQGFLQCFLNAFEHLNWK